MRVAPAANNSVLLSTQKVAFGPAIEAELAHASRVAGGFAGDDFSR